MRAHFESLLDARKQRRHYWKDRSKKITLKLPVFWARKRKARCKVRACRRSTWRLRCQRMDATPWKPDAFSRPRRSGVPGDQGARFQKKKLSKQTNKVAVQERGRRGHKRQVALNRPPKKKQREEWSRLRLAAVFTPGRHIALPTQSYTTESRGAQSR